MPVKSYIAIPKENQLTELSDELSLLEGCEVMPAENRDVLVLVTETGTEKEDKALYQRIESCKFLLNVSLVSGFD